MTYPSDFENKLGFDQIRERIAGYCLGSLGTQHVDKIVFHSDFSTIQELLHQTWELKSIKESGETFLFSQYSDPTSHFSTIAIDGTFVEAETLLQIGQSVQIAFGCVDFFFRQKLQYPRLFSLSVVVTLPRNFPNTIFSKIDDTGTIKDNASPELSRIRKKLKEEAHRARRLIEQFFRDAVNSGLVPEASSPVIRQGRVVIPVLAEHKRRIKGTILDETATGQTVFIDPTAAVEANNEIRNLELEERRESIRILKELTSLLRLHLNELKLVFEFLGNLDLIQAKARLAIELQATMPQVLEYPEVDWIQARHPLLWINHKDKDAVIPLTIDLTHTDRFLLISGPNAGGKSVCLKTVGLIQYMVQCGLLIPVLESSRVGVFEKILLDIGDQQSIENDLSTYSSHLRNMRYFVEKASANTLVLMDELGAGTDPNFGGGIAQSILKVLVEKKVWGVATTHYYNLKLFAERQDGIRNAAMLFDSKKLQPRFVLEIGKPGSSFALEIAHKTGLSPEIIKQAEENIGNGLTGLESLIKKVNDESQNLTRREKEVKLKEIRYNDLLNKYKQLSEELELKQKQIINKAKEEAALLLKQTNKEIEKTIRHIKENRAEKKETRKVRQSLEGLSKVVKVPDTEKRNLENVPLGEGDYVKIEGQEVTGRIISLKGTVAIVQFGDMRSSIKVSKLVRTNPQGKQQKAFVRSLGIDILSKQSTFNSTLDVRGSRVEEIISRLDQFLDDAMLLGHSDLRILHGKGEGVLRKVIRERLQQNKRVASFGDEHVERGGAGITLVVLK